MGWAIQRSNPGRGEIFCTRPDRPWGPPSLLYNGYRVSFPGVKRPGRGVNHPPPYSTEVKTMSRTIPPLPTWAFIVSSRTNSTLPDGMGCYCHAPAALPPGKETRYPLSRRLGGSQARSGLSAENLAVNGIQSPDRPTRSESLYGHIYRRKLLHDVT
jgi:hypothetical protein